ncbi:MAG: zinc-dependent peptidase, partial [Bacteroidetes bacterium]|nr:zinc-dependent peptidase [Bacteroidota bacterium]
MGLLLFIYYRWATRKKRLARKAVREGFPKDWRHLLASNVAFYNGLNRRQKKRFERRITIFLAQTHISGIETEVDDLSRLLIAASAVIPTWGFKDWEYPNLGEVYLTDGAVSVHEPEPGRQNITA